MPAMRLRSPSPGRGSGSERELLLSPKTLLEEPDLESGSDSEDKPDSSSPASVWSYASRSPAVAGLLRGVLLGVLAIGWMKIFHDKICGVVSNCGCTWPWAGGWKKCNIHNHDGPRCPWCVASAASKLLDVVSQKSAPLSIVCVHLIQEHMFPFGGKPATEEQHRLQLFWMGIGAACVFSLHLPAHGLFLATVPVLAAGALLLSPCRRSDEFDLQQQKEKSEFSRVMWAVGLPVSVYLTVELSWLLLFFLGDPTYPWFLWYTREASAHEHA